MQNLVSDAVVNAIEDAGERNLAELNAANTMVNVVSDFFDDPEGPPAEYDTDSSDPNLGG